MARKKMITRTIATIIAEVEYIDKSTKEIKVENAEVATSYEEEAKSYVRGLLEAKDCVLINFTVVSRTNKRYGMEERDFLAHADVLNENKEE